jgi:hypothetical protein
MATIRSVIGDRPKRREDVRFLTGRGSYSMISLSPM